MESQLATNKAYKYCKKCGRNHKHLKYCGWHVGKQKDHTANLEAKLAEAREVQKKLGEWVSNYIYCMKKVDYCGSMEDALEMEQYLYRVGLTFYA